MSLKSAIAPALHSLAMATGFSTRRAKALRVGRILVLHGVGDPGYSGAQFESLLRWLTANFSVVSLGTLLLRLTGGLTNEVALTFDDGLRNNLVHAYPRLKKFNAPATFFIVPGLVETGRWVWTHEVRARLAALPAADRRRFSAAGETDEQILKRLKQLGLKERNEAEAELRRLTPDFQPAAGQRNAYDLMSWEELRGLDPALITIGSHSLTHPILSTLTESELRVELVESRRLLENRLQRTVDLFCYPNGSHNPAVVQLAAASYRAAVTSRGDLVQPGVNLHQLPRIGVTPDTALLRWRMHRPGA